MIAVVEAIGRLEQSNPVFGQSNVDWLTGLDFLSLGFTFLQPDVTFMQ